MQSLVYYGNVCICFRYLQGVSVVDKGIPERQLSEYLTVQQAASMLGVSSSTLRNWDRLGKLKAVRHPFNGYRLYFHTDLEKILQDVAQGVNIDEETSF